MGIIFKLKTSFEATKQFYEAWIAFGVCLAAASICALVGLMIWTSNFIGSVWACILFACLLLLLAGIIKLVIDSKSREASRNFSLVREEVAKDVRAITKPLKVAQEAVPGAVNPAVPVILFVSVLIIAYWSKSQSVEPG